MDSVAVASVWSSTLLIIAFVGAVAFQQHLRHQRRLMIHRERLAAIEKGLPPPAFDEEQKADPNKGQRRLLLSGLQLLAAGVAGGILLRILAASPLVAETPELVPELAWLGLIPASVGLSQLLVYAIEERRRGSGR